MEFLKEEFGNSLLHVVEHNDEKNEAHQAIILSDKTKLHKYKNQKGEFFKEKTALSQAITILNICENCKTDMH